MTAIYAFGVVALSEELAKFLFLRYFIFKYRAFDEPYDGIVYAVMIGMGFATFKTSIVAPTVVPQVTPQIICGRNNPSSTCAAVRPSLLRKVS